ncbi:serine/threonine protein kinase, CMGC, CDC2/CDK sub [Coemansia sp. RSA 455]|nr:serine/threonine protein kinase, CMGC, CDC2/CDK sub [Coemansia sp. RSA 455]
MWGIGCIFAEMLVGKPVFQGSTDLNQIEQVMRICGSPHDSLWPGWRDMPDCKQVDEFANYPRRVREEFARFGEDAADLLDQLLQLDPRRRPDAAAALGHRLFFTSPFPARFEDMPKFEHSHEFDRLLESALIAGSNDGHRDSSNRDSFNRDSSSRRNNNYSSGTSRTSASRNAHHPYSRNNGGSSDAGWR